jgi:hypothetical protein
VVGGTIVSDETSSTQWISAHDSFREFRKGAQWLKEKKIPSMLDDKIGITVYDRSKIVEALELERHEKGSPGSERDESDAEVTFQTAENVKATGKLLQTVLGHYERMHDKNERSSKMLFDILQGQIKTQNEHILNLEMHALEMRAVTERAMSLEHERELMTKQAEHRGKIQEQALDTLKTTLGPWLMTKMGGPSAMSGGGNPAAEKVGAFTIQVLGTMSDEQFEALRPAMGDEVHAAMGALRQAIKSGEIK